MGEGGFEGGDEEGGVVFGVPYASAGDGENSDGGVAMSDGENSDGGCGYE